MRSSRYNSVAISLHWLIALLLAGLIIVGKVMTSLAADDPLRFDLTQWHKSFGILLLALVLLRLVWRLMHRPPKLPDSIAGIEKLAASGAHLMLYLLMIAIPLSGWFMVSASPLNLATELFGTIPWPHVAFFENLPDKKAVTEQLGRAHHWLAHGLLLIVVLHVGAALRHHFVLKDSVLVRMLPSSTDHASDRNFGILPGALIALFGALFLFNSVENYGIASQPRNASVTVEGDGQAQGVLAADTVGFTAQQLGEPIVGSFDEVEIALALDPADLDKSTLQATVQTASINSGDGQIDATVVTDEWFASEKFPSATFVAEKFSASDTNVFQVTGQLTIRGVSTQVDFPLLLDGNTATGELVIDRTVFGIGVGGQDEFVDPRVSIQFSAKNLP